MTTVTLQKTSKWLKAATLGSILVTVGSSALAVTHWGHRWGIVGSYGAAIGVAMWALARLVAWWQYG